MNLFGSAENDRLIGTEFDDFIDALAGNDFIQTTAGSDFVDGGTGIDELHLDANSDAEQSYTLTGSQITNNSGTILTTFENVERFWFSDHYSSGNLSFDASAWDENPNALTGVDVNIFRDFSYVVGSNLNDRFRYDGIGHEVFGGDGQDSLSVGSDDQAIAIVSDGATTSVTGATFDVTAHDVEQVYFDVNSREGQGISIDGSASNISLWMGNTAGDDALSGGSGGDLFWAFYQVIGEFVYASDGNDIYTGNGGADEFYFQRAAIGLDGVTITDYSAEDWIDLNNNVNPEFLITTFIRDAAFSGASGEYRYEKRDGQTLVQYDSDGDAVADGTLILANGEFDLLTFMDSSGQHNLSIASVIDGTSAVNVLQGTELHDKLFGYGANDTLRGGLGNDVLQGGAGWDTLEGGEGYDIIDGGNGSDTATYASASAGVTVDLSLTDYQYTWGAGFDQLVGIENLTGSGFGDTLSGDAGVNQIFGLDSDDAIFGAGGSDKLFGGAGNDIVEGGAGWDQLYGDAGDDQLSGGNGSDLLKAGTGSDLAIGGAGNDRMYGEDGNDVLIGDLGQDFLYGGAQNDTLQGGGENDELFGGYGHDTLKGGWGVDRMTGGRGTDTFVFEEGHTGKWQGNADIITDFSQGDGDLIDLSAIDAISGGSDDAFTFVSDAAFSGTAGELRSYSSGGNTYLAADMNGDGAADLQIRLDGDIVLTSADFVF